MNDSPNNTDAFTDDYVDEQATERFESDFRETLDTTDQFDDSSLQDEAENDYEESTPAESSPNDTETTSADQNQ